MDEKMIGELMNTLDNDLMLQEMDKIMEDIDINVDSIAQKVHCKIQKGRNNMSWHKRKAIAIVAASLVAVCGITTVYGAQISEFIQSLMGKTGVYGTVVDGQTYYLTEPVSLGDGHSLEQAMFTKNRLDIRLITSDEGLPDFSIKINGREIEPVDYGGGGFMFFGVKPVESFELIFNGQSFPVQLTASHPIVDGSEIIEVPSEKIPWISMGYKKIDGGIQLLAATDDPSVEVISFRAPNKDTVKLTINKQGGNSTTESPLPMLGYDKNGNAYELRDDTDNIGIPPTKYTTDAPAGEELTITLPSIVVTTGKILYLNVEIPAENEKQDISQTVDLGLQKMQLESIERTSDATAQLRFTLNTGEDKNVRIWMAYLDSEMAESVESLWENGTFVMDITFHEKTDALQFRVSNPMFLVDGDWTLHIQ